MVVKGSQKIVTDGPYAEAKDLVGGLSLIEAKDIAQAVDLSLRAARFWRSGVPWRYAPSCR
jgi:hypothetical protein